MENPISIVTGGAGFLGSALVEGLLDQGHKVYVIDNYKYGEATNIDKRVTDVIESDVRDPNMLFKHFGKTKIDFLFHFAAPSSIILFKEDFNQCVDTTMHGFMNAIKFAQHNKCRLVYPSSGSVYSGLVGINSEIDDINEDAINEYAKAKYALEKIQLAYGNSVDALALRIFAGYGPREWHKGYFASVIYMFATQMIAGEQPTIFGDGTQTRDFIYQDDIANAIIDLAFEADEPIVNVGSGKSISFNEIVETINIILGTDIQPNYVDKPTNYLESTQADTKLMDKYLTSQLTPIEDGISQVIKSLKDNE